MNNQEIYTFTILRNFGEPKSLTIRKKTLIIGLSLIVLVLGLLLFSALNYLILGQQNQKLKTQLATSNKKANLLFKEIALMDKKRFGPESSFSFKSLEQALTDQKKIITNDLANNLIDLTQSTESLEEGVNILVKDIKVKLSGSKLTFTVQIQNKTLPAEDQGGYIWLTLSNQDEFPTTYKAVTKGDLGEEGFPASYKLGRQYMVRSKKTRKIKTTYKIKDDKEYYTHIMVFIYSYKGTLLSRFTKPINKKIFFE